MSTVFSSVFVNFLTIVQLNVFRWNVALPIVVSCTIWFCYLLISFCIVWTQIYHKTELNQLSVNMAVVYDYPVNVILLDCAWHFNVAILVAKWDICMSFWQWVKLPKALMKNVCSENLCIVRFKQFWCVRVAWTCVHLYIFCYLCQIQTLELFPKSSRFQKLEFQEIEALQWNTCIHYNNKSYQVLKSVNGYSFQPRYRG